MRDCAVARHHPAPRLVKRERVVRLHAFPQRLERLCERTLAVQNLSRQQQLGDVQLALLGYIVQPPLRQHAFIFE